MRKKSRRPFDPFTRLELKDTLGRAMDEMAERLKAQGAAITHRCAHHLGQMVDTAVPNRARHAVGILRRPRTCAASTAMPAA